MYTSSVLTGYNHSSISVFDSPSPEPSQENILYAMVEKYVDGCSYEGWKAPSTLSSNGCTELDGSQERLHGSFLFSPLPWFTPNLAECFKLPQGRAKVLLFF